MAKLPMQKIEIIALLSDAQKVVERLQRRGVVELENIEDERLVKYNTASSVAQFERCLAAAKQALESIDEYAPEKSSPLAFLNGRNALSTNQFADKKEKTDKTMIKCYDIGDHVKKIAESKNNIVRLQTAVDILKEWLTLNLPQDYKGTKFTRTFIGSLPGQSDAQMIEQSIISFDPDLYFDVQVISSRKEQTLVSITCHKDKTESMSSALRELGFTAIPGHSHLTPKEDTERMKKEIDSARKQIETSEKQIADSGQYRDDVRFLIDFLQMRMDKYIAIGELATTHSTVIISGFIPKKYASSLVKEFESKYTVAISVTDPSDDEDVPVLLSNNRFAAPVEGITEMYALPNKRDVDPSPIMAFFYYLFFGMMLSDAGYGLIMVIATTLILNKTTVEGSLRKSLRMFQYCGISTLFWGALFGSWFGDLPQIIAQNFFGKTIQTTALWFEPLNDPIKLLLFSFGLGICHLFLGLAVNFHIIWKEGRKLDAVFEVVPVYMTILGVAPIAASILADVPAMFINVGKYLAIVGVVALVLTAGRSSKNIFMRFFGGIYGLYNVATGYLSDILSYSRLLALGLATGSIAGVINLICTMPENPVLKAIFLIVVGSVAHVANMGINLLGAYVHSDRLQFVELFSKFYEGGGRAFNPLKVNTKYYKFDKENTYE